MPKKVQNKKYFAFTGGLNTDASYLTFPPNTWQEGYNVVPHIDGILRRRRGVDFETGYAESSQTLTAAQKTAFACTHWEWNSVGGNGSLHFLVVQMGYTLKFYINSGTPISTQAKSFIVDLSLYRAPGNTEIPGVAPVQCVNANGKLLVVSRDIEPLLLTYNKVTDTLSVETITIKMRDFIGFPDDAWGIDGFVSINKGTPLIPVWYLSPDHHYNLLNQGWPEARITQWNAEAHPYATGIAHYPKNNDIWYRGKNSSGDWTYAQQQKTEGGTGWAPKGHFILDAHRRDRSGVSGVSGFPTEVEPYRPSTAAFFAGRAWYAGYSSAVMGSWVMFSQVAETGTLYGRCYQEGDPTNEFDSTLVDTDGGIVPIQDAGEIKRLFASDKVLYVFAENGIWAIHGGSDIAFSATNYQVSKISSVRCIAPFSIVETSKGLMFLGEGGVFALSSGEGGGVVADNISLGRVNGWIDGIPEGCLSGVQGLYDKYNHIVYFFHGLNDGNAKWNKDAALCYNIPLNSFYVNRYFNLGATYVFLTGAFFTHTSGTTTSTEDVVDNVGNLVQDGSANQVVATFDSATTFDQHLRFVAFKWNSGSSVFKLTFAGDDNTYADASGWRDFYSLGGGTDTQPYIITGYDGGGVGGEHEMQMFYLHAFMPRTETGFDANGDPIRPNSVSLTTRWNWSNSIGTTEHTAAQELYRHKRALTPVSLPGGWPGAYDLVVTKNKVRGRGKAIQLKFTATADKDFQIAGWAADYLGNQT